MHRDYKRYIKNVLLSFLIAMSFILTLKLWSVDYYFGNGFIGSLSALTDKVSLPITNFFEGFTQKDRSKSLEAMLRPKRIALNWSNKRSIINEGDGDYMKFYEASFELFNKIESGEIKIKSSENVSSDDYLSVLKGKSILIDYDNKYDYKIFSSVLTSSDKTRLSDDISIIREYIISLSDNVLNYTTLYIKDYKTNNIYKYMFEYDKKSLEMLLSSRLSSSKTENTPLYAFELNFHKRESSDGTVSKTVFNPFASVVLYPEERNVVKPHRYSQDEDARYFNESDILKKFNINTMTVNKYVDVDGVKVFVENDATLKISPDGYLEYKALEGGRGIAISDVSGKTPQGSASLVSLATDFVMSVYRSLPSTANVELRISEDVPEEQKQTLYTVRYDYFINGMAIFQFDNASQKIVNAVTVEIENGYLKYYKHYLRTYEFIDKKYTAPSMIKAADALVSKISSAEEQIVIERSYECFVDDGAPELKAEWVFGLGTYTGLFRQ